MTDFRITVTVSLTATEQDGSENETVEMVQDLLHQLIEGDTAFEDIMVGLYAIEPIGEETSRPRFRKT